MAGIPKFNPSYKTIKVIDTAAEALKRSQIDEMFAAKAAKELEEEAVRRAALSKGEAFSNPPRLSQEPIPEPPPLRSAEIVPGDTGLIPYNQNVPPKDFIDVGNVPKDKALTTTPRTTFTPEEEINLSMWGKQHGGPLKEESMPMDFGKPIRKPNQFKEDLPDPASIMGDYGSGALSKGDLYDLIKDHPKALAAFGLGAAGAGAAAFLSNKGPDPTSIRNAKLVETPKEPKKVETKEAEIAPKAMEKATEVAAAKPEEESSEDETVEEKTEEVKSPELRTLDFGKGSVASMENLQAVQDQGNKIRGTSAMMQAIETIGSGLSGIGSGGKYQTKVDSKDFYAGLNKQADQLMVDYKAKIDMEKLDPNSSYTQGLKDFIKKSYGYDIKGDISAKDLQDSVMKPLEKQWEQKLLDKRQRELKQLQLAQLKEQGEQRKASQDLAREAQQQRHEEKLDSTKEGRNQREFAQFYQKMMNAGGTAGNQVRQRINAADSVFATVDADPNITVDEISKIPKEKLNKVSRVLVTELGLEVNRMLSSGTPAASTLAKLIPDNINMSVTRLQDYANGKLNPADQEDFVRNMLKVAARVKEVSKNQNLEYVKKLIAPTKKLQQYDPEAYDALITEHGLTPEEVDRIHAGSKGKELPKAKVSEKAEPVQNQKAASPGKTVESKHYNPNTNQTIFKYTDGTGVIKEGKL